MKIALLLLTLIFQACAPMPDEGKTAVRFQLPESRNQSSMRHYRPQSEFSTNSVTDLSQIDCYAIVVSYGGSQGECIDSASTVITTANEAHGSFPDGAFIEIFVSAGLARTFHLYGFSYDVTAGSMSGTGMADFCPDFISFPILDQQASSKPILLGSKTVDVEGEFMEISMTRDLANGTEIHTCQNAPFQWETQSIALWDQALWDQAQWGP